jgi:hypothetical protein
MFSLVPPLGSLAAGKFSAFGRAPIPGLQSDLTANVIGPASPQGAGLVETLWGLLDLEEITLLVYFSELPFKKWRY